MTFFAFISRDLVFGAPNRELYGRAPKGRDEIEKNCYGEIVGNLDKLESRQIEGDLDDHTAERTARLWKRYCR